MADISNVRYEEIKDITENLEGLTCTFVVPMPLCHFHTNIVSLACIMTRVLY